jgi:plastocyanin
MRILATRFGFFGAASALAVVLAFAALFTFGGSSAVAQDATNITIQNFAFSPNSVTITAGSSVTWTNMDSVTHSATGDNGAFDTGVFAAGGSATITFDNAGTFTYHCSIHPNMTGTIVVQAAGGNSGGGNSGGGNSGGGNSGGGTSGGGTTQQLPNTGSGGLPHDGMDLAAYVVLAALTIGIGGLAMRLRAA